MTFIILDAEYTFSIDDVNFKEKEIVQLAAIKVDAKNFKVKDHIFYYIKPQINPIIPQCLIDYTNITQHDINTKGILLENAYQKLSKFCGDSYVYTHGWRDGFDSLADGDIINNNLNMLGIAKYEKINYINIAPWFQNQYTKNKIKIEKQTSGQIAKLLGKESELLFLNSNEHNALYDCYSILVGIKYFNGNNLKEFSKKFAMQHKNL